MTAFEQGLDAFGRGDRDCPFEPDTEQFEDWTEGWHEAAAAEDPEIVDNL